MKNLDQPNIIVNEIQIQSVDDLISEVDKFIYEYCKDISEDKPKQSMF